MAFVLLNLLVCFLTVVPALAKLQRSDWAYGTSASQRILEYPTSSTRNYSVGFHLMPTYGSAAVIVDDAYEEQKTFTWVVYGDNEHLAVMERLSLLSSRHRAPPYGDVGDGFFDYPRRLYRDARRKLGLPASADVGTLSKVIKALKTQIEADLRIHVADATMSTTFIEALYQDDIRDICDYAGFTYVIPKELFPRPMVYETSAAHDGYGFGLCEHWQNDTQCMEEELKMPEHNILGVHLDRKVLTSTLAMTGCQYAFESSMQRVVNFRLGSDAKQLYECEEDYWRDVKEVVLRRMKQYRLFDDPQYIIMSGDMVTAEFADFVVAAVEEFLGVVLPVYWEDALVVSAKGIAELRRRGKAALQVIG